MNTALSLVDLSKRYGRHRRSRLALNKLTIHVPYGSFFGLVGPNGAGKSTALKCALGHLRPTTGESFLLGAKTLGDINAVIDEVGVVTESPRFLPSLTGEQNLSYLASLRQPRNALSVSQALEQVDLSHARSINYSAYSTGMRQRLSLASAFLKRPNC